MEKIDFLHNPLFKQIEMRSIVIFVFLIISIQGFTQTSFNTKQLDPQIEEIIPHLMEYRSHIHQNPEISYHETETAKYVADKLRSWGYEVHTKYGGGYGVVGILNKGAKPYIGIRADMDALPVEELVDSPIKSTKRALFEGVETGISHACGHDVHTAAALATAELISKDKSFSGSMMFIFQPAEEGGKKEGLLNSGAEQMLADGLFEDLPKPEVLFTLHVIGGAPTGFFGLNYGLQSANSAFFEVKLKGVQGHGSSPWVTKDPISCAAQIITTAQTVVSREADLTKGAAVVTFASIHGGLRENIIPSEVVMKGTIRNLDTDNHNLVLNSLKKKIKAVAEMNDIEADVIYYNPVPALYNNATVSKNTARVLKSIPTAQNVSDEIQAGTGYDDASQFHNLIPACYFLVGGADPTGKIKPGGNHTPYFFISDEAVKNSFIAFAYLVYDYLNNPYLSGKP